MKKAKKLGYTLLGILLAGVVGLVGIILYAEYSGHRFKYDGKDKISEIDFPDEASRLVYDENGNIAEFPEIPAADESEENPGESASTGAGQTEGGNTVNPAPEDGVHTFIMDTQASLFHYDTCPDVQAISEGNRLSMTGTREQVSERGYEPCPDCKP